MLNNCLVIDEQRWEIVRKTMTLIYSMDFIVIKSKSSFMFVKNRIDGKTNISIPIQYFAPIMEYYAEKQYMG